MYIDSHEGLYAADCELPLGIFGEAPHCEIEPALRIDSMFGLDSIIDAIKPILSYYPHTLNSVNCRMSCTLPDSKPQLMWMYLYREPR
jgi:hypothetical protein